MSTELIAIIVFGIVLILLNVFVLLHLIRPSGVHSAFISIGIAIKEKKYLKVIQDSSSENKLFMAQHCFNRLPQSYTLLKTLWHEIKGQIDSDITPPKAKRELIRAVEAARKTHLSVCPVKNLELPKDFIDEIENISGNIISELEKESLLKLSQEIESLEKKVLELENKNDKNAILNEISEIDERINKTLLRNDDLFNKRYNIASRKVADAIAIMNESGDLSDLEKKYNINAIESHKEALEIFKKEQKKFTKGEELERLGMLIGGWRNQHLTPATGIYMSTIYGQIFSKLNPEAQLKFTHNMTDMANSKSLDEPNAKHGSEEF